VVSLQNLIADLLQLRLFGSTFQDDLVLLSRHYLGELDFVFHVPLGYRLMVVVRQVGVPQH